MKMKEQQGQSYKEQQIKQQQQQLTENQSQMEQAFQNLQQMPSTSDLLYNYFGG